MVLDRIMRICSRNLVLQGWRPVPIVVLILLAIYMLALKPMKSPSYGNKDSSPEEILSSLLGTDIHNRKLLDVNKGKLSMHDLLSIKATTPKQPRYTGTTTWPPDLIRVKHFAVTTDFGPVRPSSPLAKTPKPWVPGQTTEGPRSRSKGVTKSPGMAIKTDGPLLPGGPQQMLPYAQQPQQLSIQQQQMLQQQLLWQLQQQQQQQQPQQQQQQQQQAGFQNSLLMNGLMPNVPQKRPSIPGQQVIPIAKNIVFQPQQGAKTIVPANQVSVNGVPLTNGQQNGEILAVNPLLNPLVPEQKKSEQTQQQILPQLSQQLQIPQQSPQQKLPPMQQLSQQQKQQLPHQQQVPQQQQLPQPKQLVKQPEQNTKNPKQQQLQQQPLAQQPQVSQELPKQQQQQQQQQLPPQKDLQQQLPQQPPQNVEIPQQQQQQQAQSGQQLLAINTG